MMLLMGDLHERHPEVMALAAKADVDPRTALSWIMGRVVRGPQARSLARHATEDQTRARRQRLEEFAAAVGELLGEGEVRS